MSVFIYLTISIIFFLAAFLIVYFRLRYLYKNPENYNEDHDGHEEFLDFFFSHLHTYFKNVYEFLKLFYTNLFHKWVILVEKIKYLFEKIYTNSRDRFVKEVIKDKNTVPQFWDHLKKYKREKDSESRIDDDSMGFINK